MTMSSNLITDIPELEAAVSEQRLFERALLDCIEALCRFTVLDRSTGEAIRVLSGGCDTFTSLDHKRALEKARRI